MEYKINETVYPSISNMLWRAEVLQSNTSGADRHHQPDIAESPAACREGTYNQGPESTV